MKKIPALIVICLTIVSAFSSCRRSATQQETSAADSLNTELSDSLATAMAEKDSLMALMSDISDGMNQIKQMENFMSSKDLNSETPDKKVQLRNDMVLIQRSIEQHKKRLEELEKRLSRSTNYSDAMKKTIANLKSQIEEQQNTIANLTSQLAAAHIEIKNLNTRVDSLNTVNTTVSREKKQAQEESVRLNNELNVCYYVVGSKKELKKNKIIQTGFLRKTKIMEGDFERSYFTKADKRTLSLIALHSKKAEVLSKHPAGSYQIVEDANGLKSLKITDSSRFWELSNFLIVKVD